MKIVLLLGIFSLVLLLVSCAPQQILPFDEQAVESPSSEITVADQQVLEQYPDNLDAALEELEMVG